MMAVPGSLPPEVQAVADSCDECEVERRPRMFICSFHEGWWDGWNAYEEAER